MLTRACDLRAYAGGGHGSVAASRPCPALPQRVRQVLCRRVCRRCLLRVPDGLLQVGTVRALRWTVCQCSPCTGGGSDGSAQCLGGGAVFLSVFVYARAGSLIIVGFALLAGTLVATSPDPRTQAPVPFFATRARPIGVLLICTLLLSCPVCTCGVIGVPGVPVVPGMQWSWVASSGC